MTGTLDPTPAIETAGRRLPPGVHGFDSIEPGDHVVTADLTVTADMVDRFADLSGDRFELHMSDEAANALGFPARVAHGLLVLSLIDGLKNQAPAQLLAIATLNWDMGFRRPVLLGDSIRAEYRLQSKRLASDGKRGIAVFAVTARNQRDEVVQTGQTTLMMRR